MGHFPTLSKSTGYVHHMLIGGDLTMGKPRVRVQHADGPVWYNSRDVENRGQVNGQ
jgi:hypothetical protein